MADEPRPAKKRTPRPPTCFGVLRFTQAGCNLLFGGLHQMQVHGREYIPRSGPAVLMGNHESFLDPLLIIQLTMRPILFAAKEELFEVWNGYLFPRLNCIPVKRGTADMAMFRAAARHLKRGRLFGLFPEGTRSPDGVIGPAQPGAIAIALWSGVPIIPIGMAGTHSVLPRQGGYTRLPIGIEAGPPLVFGDALRSPKVSKDEIELVGRRVMDEIARLKRRIEQRLGYTDDTAGCNPPSNA
ncbi:MAG: 1-acyl-sn-glycerol-3-phosphate acyltransferase [Armatimonadetes bacterium]|nr:1-acyl-sn-glycerol-3-phosphate acyltransferase [Armatimonadota bacterium]